MHLHNVQERRTDQSLAARAARSEHPRRVEEHRDWSRSRQDQEEVLVGQFTSARCSQRKRSHPQAACIERRVSLQTWIPQDSKCRH